MTAKRRKRKPRGAPSSLKALFARLKTLEFFSGGEEKEYFAENLSLLVGSGMGIIPALEAIKAESKSVGMRKTIENLQKDIEGGLSLSGALEKTGILPAQAIALIRIGEESGGLAKNLELVAENMNKERDFRSRVRSATAYPILVLSLTLVVGIGISWFTLPQLASVFAKLNLDLPILTKILIRLGEILGSYGAIIIPSLIVTLAAVIYFIFFFKKTKFLGQAFLLRVPGVKKLIQESEVARFGYITGNMLAAGIPVTEAISSLTKASSFSTYQKFYFSLKKNIEDGLSFRKSFAANKSSDRIIPVPIQQMIAAAEESGRLPETFIHIGETLEGKLDNTAKEISVVLEPALLVIVWLGVVSLAAAVILPIYSLIGGLGEETSVTQPAITETTTEARLWVEILPGGSGTLNVRNAPSPDGEILERIEAEESRPYVREQNNWYEIILRPGETGWVSSEYSRVAPQ